MFPDHTTTGKEQIDPEAIHTLNITPFILIAASFLFITLYNATLDHIAIGIYRDNATLKINHKAKCPHIIEDAILTECTSTLTRQEILDKSYISISGDSLLRTFYILIFVTAECTFIIMATREYIQELLQIQDKDLIITKASHQQHPQHTYYLKINGTASPPEK